MLPIFLIFYSAVRADLPVHCTYSSLIGNWTFTLDSSTFTADLDKIKSTCGHGQPGKVQDFDSTHKFSFPESTQVTLSLETPNVVHSEEYGEGTWTLIYDEGFIIYFNDLIFTNYFFYYTSGKDHKSDCTRTMLGWVRWNLPDPLEKWACFYAEKQIEAGQTENIQIETLTETTAKPSSTSFLQGVNYDDKDRVSTINSLQTKWKAEISPRFAGLSFADINSQFRKRGKIELPQTKSSSELIQGQVEITAGPLEVKLSQTDSTSQSKSEGSSTSDDAKVEEVQDQKLEYWDSSALGKTDRESLIFYWNSTLDQIDGSQLPLVWDWTDIGGVSYISDTVRDQGHCGSCYAVTSTEMLESRLRILTDFQFSASLSIEYLISCSFYTEGCQGGYPTLLHKFIQEFGLVTESCMPYKGKIINCSERCSTSDIIGVSDYYLVGGYYGAVTEENIMKELRSRGPLIVDLDPNSDFFYYKSGVYSQTSLLETDSELNTQSLRDLDIEWEEVTHSVLLVGWGEDEGEKYWKCLNSWGNDWGEAGYFRIRRGNDDSHIESMAEAATPFIRSSK